MTQDTHNTPTEPGLYLAKSDCFYKWWDLLVYVYGKPPYLRWRLWDYDRNTQPDQNIFFLCFGPRIAQEINEDGLIPLDKETGTDIK
jgi:hypothetical protein